MDKVIIYTRAEDGGITMVIPYVDPNSKETEQELLERMIRKVPEGSTYTQVIDRSNIPSDGYFRGAWKQDGKKITVDMDKAQQIHMDTIRVARNKALSELDVETIKALGKGDNKLRDEVETKKQVLRDLPTTVKLNVAKTPEKLKAIWPKELP